ncbi:MAG TPA: flagellar filament capping protein FliD [Steroidobacteraceae bacterium]|nr:flagellar filament capping protein FliD [Steroidobacteraceae bacterium]
MADTSVSVPSISSSVTGTLSSAGIGSGLDVNSLVSQLVQAERAPTDQRLQNESDNLTTQVSAVASLKGALSSLQTAVEGLTGTDSFDVRKTTQDDNTYFSATADSAAVTGHYDVEVVQLATAGRISSGGFPSSGGGANTTIGTGTLAINVGSQEFKVNIDSSHDTLAQIRDAINSAADNKGVTATLITDQDGTHLVLAGTQTGAANAVSVNLADSVDADGSTSDNSGLSQLFGMAAKDPVKDVAQDAIVNVGGFEIHSASNTIDSAIDGVTLVLKKANDTGDTTGLDISRDDDAIQAKAQSFVDAFNTLAGQISTLGSYDADSQTAGPMLGDSLLIGIDSQARRILSAQVPGITGSYRTLASLGITTAADGTLQLDATKFQGALAADPQAVTQIFASSNGVAAQMDSFLTDKLSATGDIANRNTSLNDSEKELQDEQDALNTRMQVVQDQYMQQFTALDTLLSQMQSTSTYLTQELSGLSDLANYTTTGGKS